MAGSLGIHFMVVPRIYNKRNSIEAARNFLRMCWIDEEHCAQAIRCLDSYCKEWGEKHGTYKIAARPQLGLACERRPANRRLGFVPEYIPPPNDRYYRKPRPAAAWAA